jgi:hypothetical protein
MMNASRLWAAAKWALGGLPPAVAGIPTIIPSVPCLPCSRLPAGIRVRVIVLIIVVIGIVGLRAFGLDLLAAIATISAAGVLAGEISERLLRAATSAVRRRRRHRR